MKTTKYLLFIFGLVCYAGLFAQADINNKLLKINRKIDSIVQSKSRQFETELQQIDNKLSNRQLNKKEAEKAKKRLAKQYAEDLDYTIYKLAGDLKRIGKGSYITDSIIDNRTAYNIRKVKLYSRFYYKRESCKNKNTHTYVFLTLGLNNVLDRDKVESIEFSPYGYIQSRFFEIGMDWKTNFLHKKAFLVYGFSFIWNTLKPGGNKYHVVSNDTVNIVTHPYDLERSKLRHIWLKVPLSIELNFPDSKRGHLNLSAGIYGKFRLITKQKLTYFADGNSHDEVIKDDYTMPNFAYGLTGAVGGTDWSVYADYDLTPLFKNSKTHLISLGLKWRL